MRAIAILLCLCFFSFCCRAQKTQMYLDSINPIIKYDSHGDSIRKYFSTIRCESSNAYTKFFLPNGKDILISKPIFEYEGF